MLELLEFSHPDALHGQVIGLGDTCSFRVIFVENVEENYNLVLTSINEVASFSPSSNLFVVEGGVFGKIEDAITISISCIEISTRLSHYLVHGFGALLHGCHEVLIDFLLGLGGSLIPVLDRFFYLSIKLSSESFGEGGLLYVGHLLKALAGKRIIRIGDNKVIVSVFSYRFINRSVYFLIRLYS